MENNNIHKVFGFIRDGLVDARDEKLEGIENDARKSERTYGIQFMVEALLEVKTDDATIISLLQKYWQMSYKEASDAVKTIKTIEHPMRLLKEFLSSEGYSESEIKNYMREKHVSAILLNDHDLWKLTPGQLKKRLDTMK